VGEGRHPSVAEVADAAGVSRRTAYRYFPTQQKLLVEAALEGLRPEIEGALVLAPSGASPLEMQGRVDALVRVVQERAVANEHRLRTMVHLTVIEKPPPGTRPRGGRRVEWVELALAPLKPRLSRSAYSRLVSALSLVVGIEALLVLRDIRGLTAPQALQVSLWMARAVLGQAMREAGFE
jgi:AcrR family transcriptional regulator